MVRGARHAIIYSETQSNHVVYIHCRRLTPAHICAGKLDKRRKGVYGPPMGQQSVIFIDDLNMPEVETYGAQPPIELIRQLIDNGGWYATSPPPFHVSQRFNNHSHRKIDAGTILKRNRGGLSSTLVLYPPWDRRAVEGTLSRQGS